MDLSVILEDKKLNIRTTAVIIHENKLLVHKNANEDFCALVGGRIKIGENSEEAIKREIFEEMGKKIEIQKYLTTIENFFKADDMTYHEIMFVYKADFENEEDKKIITTIKNIEGENELKYKWVSIDELEKANLQPVILRNMIKNNDFSSHAIYDERK